MAAATHSVTLDGLSGRPIEVEVDISAACRPRSSWGWPTRSSTRRATGAGRRWSNSGTTWPDQRVTINLAPSTLPKSGSHYDLAIALAVFAAKSLVPAEALADAAFLGELALDGRLRAVRGVLPATLAAAEAGFDRVFVPEVNVPEAELVGGISVVGVRSLRQTVALLTGAEEPDDPPVPPLDEVPSISWTRRDRLAHLDLADIAGQEDSRMALVVAAAGGHHLLMTGPPGIGKTMLAQRLPGAAARSDVRAVARGQCRALGRRGPAERRPAAAAPAVPRPAPHRERGVDRRRWQQGHPARRAVAGPSRGAVPRRGAGVRLQRARGAAATAGERARRGVPGGA